MLHEEKAAAIKRLMKKGQLPAQLTEVDENGNRWPTKEALISAKKVDFGTDVRWRLLCEHWSGAEFRGLSLRNKRNRLANGDTVFHCSGARNAVATRQFLVLYLRQASFFLCLTRKFHLHWMMFHTLEMQTLKTGKDPGISGAWLHTHNLHRGTDEEKICSQRTADHWVSEIL